MTHHKELEGKVALVTGGSRRMGRAICLRLAEAGVSVVVNGKEGRENAEAVAREVEGMGVRSRAILADITKPDAVRKMADETLSTFGRLDILVNTVAVRTHTPLMEITLDEWHSVLATILDGTFLCSQTFGPELMKNNGTIVNIGGASAHVSRTDHASVAAGKLGLIGLTRALAADLAPNVVVNCLVPGRIDGPGDKRDEGGRYALKNIPLGRSGTLEEVAEAVTMLCNPRCRFITGQAIHISGGMLVGL